jgi:RecJ-like exonuclease
MSDLKNNTHSDFIQLDTVPKDHKEIALWYLRYKLIASGDTTGKHICPKCKGNIGFSVSDIKGDEYHKYVVAFCNNCRVKSNNHVYPKYNYGIVEFAEGALHDAIKEIQEGMAK